MLWGGATESNQLEVAITEGRNRIVRRLFEHLGYSVISLKRLSIGPFNLANLKVGELKRFPKSDSKRLYKIII